MNRLFKRYLLLIGFVLVVVSCAPEPEPRGQVLYNQYCASCHMAPSIDHLPKDIWKNSVLPDMAARMQIEELYNDPSTVQEGFRPKIKLADWVALEEYILNLAPEELPETPRPTTKAITGFKEKPLEVDNENGAFYTYLAMDTTSRNLLVGNIQGQLFSYDVATGSSTQKYQGTTPITWYSKQKNEEFITEVGILDPSELERGKIVKKVEGDTLSIAPLFHRPVHTLVEDLNKDGNLEMVVSEFGNEKGQLSLVVSSAAGEEKRTLLNQPGCIRTVSKDMDGDGLLDLVVITSQGNESITVLYQKESLKFEASRVLEFPSIYGSSWFELVDYNKDGFVDIITVNGDNADKSYVHKPYHGMRIHLNDGQNNFTETYFYPLNGATRVTAHDFDEDGDIDFGVLSTFPNYDEAPELSFVYLENTDAENYLFSTQVLTQPNAGRWFLLDKGDVDSDGDMDIVLSSFTYVFTPVPDALSKQWSNTNVDLLLLENLLEE